MHGRTLAIALALVLGCAAPAAAETRTFSYTGAMETWTVPAKVTTVTVTLEGAQGGPGCRDAADARPGAPGGRGARVQATLTVTPGQVLEVRAGGQGEGPDVRGETLCANGGGFNGGNGWSGISTDARQIGGGGGGATDLRIAGGATLAIAAGGGGGGGTGANGGGAGGAGGDSGSAGASGAQVVEPAGGGGASGATGGAGGAEGGGDGAAYGGPGYPGSAGLGGRGAQGSWDGGMGGGGGGGLVGGGGGGAGSGDGPPGGGGGGGGGGSSLVPAGGTLTDGARTGDGRVVLEWAVTEPALDPQPVAPVLEPPAIAEPDPVVTDPGQLLLCAGREVALIDLRRRGRRVELAGLALGSLTGKRVTIRADRGGARTSAVVAADGTFAASLPWPRDDQTSYVAGVGASRSAPLKVSRHLRVVQRRGRRIVARHSKGARVAGETATLVRQRGCGLPEVAGAATFDGRGRVAFVLEAPAPPDTVAVYRVSAETNRTYTLPLVVRR